MYIKITESLGVKKRGVRRNSEGPGDNSFSIERNKIIYKNIPCQFTKAMKTTTSNLAHSLLKIMHLEYILQISAITIFEI